MDTYIRKDDSVAVMRAIGSAIPVMLREAVDDGFHNYAVSRSKDPDAFPEYSDCTKGNMLYDRIAASARQLIDAMAPELPDVWWKITQNKRATDIFLGTLIAFRIKRTKRNRGNLTTSVDTSRQRAIKSSDVGNMRQLVFPFPCHQVVVADAERIWVTVGFDLDDLDEFIDKVAIGVEVRKRFLWKELLPAADSGVIATLSPSLADKIDELRSRRSA